MTLGGNYQDRGKISITFAILSAYPNRSIHGNHMEMTKFGSETDSGYIAVRDQLWLWVNALDKKTEAQSTEEIRERRTRSMCILDL